MDEELNLLVVEDDPVDAGIIRRVLEQPGLHQHVQCAPNLAAAKERLKGEHFDAVLLDLGLPDSNGLDAVTDMQAAAPELPIVVLSGNTDPELAVRSVDLGAEDYILKGQLDRTPVARSLRYAVERHRRKVRLFQDNNALWRSLQSARREAETDPLTGVPNRRGLEMFLRSQGSNPSAEPATVMVVDLDKFKEINDEHGHDVGDAVLREATARMLANLGPEDFLARVGGDEFVVLLKRQGRRSALRTARQMLAKLYEEAFVWAGQRVKFSATVGLFEIELDGATLEQMLSQAHPLLQRGKTGGRARMELGWGDEGVSARQPDAETRAPKVPAKSRPVLGLSTGKDLGQLYQLSPECWLASAKQGEPPWLTALRWCRDDFHQRNGSGLMHVDLEASAMAPGFSDGLAGLFDEGERLLTVLHFHTRLNEARGGAALEEIRLLRELGFQIGVRGLGDGSTHMENLIQLGPQWVRFDLSATLGLGTFTEKAVELNCLSQMLKPLHARTLAEEAGDEATLTALRLLSFEGYIKL
jgi:diguanylate cyclase (GGDEF)-like protein